MKVTLLHPGNQHAPHLARQLFRLDLLDKFITSFAVSEGRTAKLVRTLLKRRVLSGLPAEVIQSYPAVEILSRVESWIEKNQEVVLFHRNARFQDRVIKNDLAESSVVIGFDTSSWKVAQYCRGAGKRFILDVTIGHSRSKEEIYDRLRSDYPEWMRNVPRKCQAMIELEQQELNDAAQVVVPSAFVRQTLIENGVDERKIIINPFGSSLISYRGIKKFKRKTITFLFFGALTARKGLPVLLAAWKRMNRYDCQLLLAGYGGIPSGVELPKGVTVLGTISPADRVDLFSRADVFVFPSFFEGLAQVLIEAAASGLPIIATPNSGASEIVSHAYNGFLIQEGNVVELVEAMNFFVGNPEEIDVMSERVIEVRSKFTWDSYGERWEKILKS